MKNLIKSTLIMLAMSHSIIGQDNPRPVNDKIEAARIGMITNRLDLSSQQATAFWPVYNEYEDKKTSIKKDLRKHLGESRSLASTDDKIIVELKDMMALRQQEVDVDKEYLTKFLKVLNPRQVSELYRTEQMFKQMLLKRLENRREMNDKGPKGMKGPK
jgi:Spy/CpxP family protein refolding chaperone